MLPIQILLNNFLYDLSELTIPTDNVDPEYVEKPKRLNITFVRRFMLFLGPISSIFDLLTFVIMLTVFNVTVSNPGSVLLFQTAWFIESLSTQTLVIFIIRTSKSPFYKSRPSKLLIFSSLGIVVFAFLMPLTPLGALFKFVVPPLAFFVLVLGLICTYLILVEIVKKWFYKRYALV
jgi:Mg2+-importing ATPase